MEIRFAREDELGKVNDLRKQVNDLHVEGKPEIFKAGFNDEMRNFIYYIWNDPEQEIIVADADGTIIKNYTREKGIKRLELNMWEFNQGALEFYEKTGFKTYRRYMEMFV